ncbi:hypothetical protein ACFL9U_07890 [Thermodesulfobacteriota bacterium]
MSDVPDRVDVPLVDAAVVFINQTVAEKVSTGSLEIGAYLLKTFFNNDIELATSKDSNKPVSYSALCSRPDLAVSRWTLSRMVRVAAQEKFLASKRVRTTGLSYVQRMELIKLPNDDRKVELVRHCIKEGLATRDLIPLINQEYRKSVPPPKPVSPAMAANGTCGSFSR